MSEYLDRIENGADAKTVVLEISEELEESKNVINSILDRVLHGGDRSELVTDIVNMIPNKFIKSNGDI